MIDGYVVDGKALEADAATFGRWVKKLDAIAAAVPAGFPADTFSYIPQAQEVYAKYMAAARALEEYVQQGSVVFAGFERTLLQTVIVYAAAEKLSAADVARVTAELGAL